MVARTLRASRGPETRARCSRKRATATRQPRRNLSQALQPMVRRIARGIHGRRGAEDLEDLIQVGMVGLLEAIDRFDPERGAFAPYASVTIAA